MNKKDLKEVLEITGLTSEKMLADATPQVANNEELKKHVGRSCKCRGFYGMVDKVHGSKLGFIHCEGDTWTGSVVDVSECEWLTNESEIKKARQSAMEYCKNEKESIEHRIALNLKFDDKKKLADMLRHVSFVLKHIELKESFNLEKNDNLL